MSLFKEDCFKAVLLNLYLWRPKYEVYINSEDSATLFSKLHSTQLLVSIKFRHMDRKRRNTNTNFEFN